ncbi:MAG: anthranilate phosphoribosyltransferase [Campylobacteraceae bacterium]|jgi:anthranilate phosphoribosyltransferase|nr:anthranilate phosphoribosyltransferase [Campylobacteraceae bacterium]
MNFLEAKKAFAALFQNELSEWEARSLLTTLYENGENEEEIAAAATVMRSHSIRLSVPFELQSKIIDIVGTGGDKSKSINISSTAAIILASLGCYVAKHGNRAITSNSGSADMLEAVGINLSIPKEGQIKMLEDTNFTFMFAVNHHPAMSYIMPIRRSIPHPTIFNIIGPLCNPAGAKKGLIGVLNPSFNIKMANAAKLLNNISTLVVSSNDGMDEISVSSVTKAAMLKDGKVVEFEIDPQKYGIKISEKQEVVGGDASQNAKIALDTLTNKEKGAKRDIVLINTAFTLILDDKARDVQEGLEMARMAIESGKAKDKLDEIIKFSHMF